MMDKVYVLLKETPPDGENFAQIVNNILEREEYWNVWKNDGCPGKYSISLYLTKGQNETFKTNP